MTCPYCQHDRVVYVHGHGQCARCGINIEPCCDGAVCEGIAVSVRDSRETEVSLGKRSEATREQIDMELG